MKKQRVTSTQAWDPCPPFLSLVKRCLCYTSHPRPWKPTLEFLLAALLAHWPSDVTVHRSTGLASCAKSTCRLHLSVGPHKIRGGRGYQEPIRLKTSHTAYKDTPLAGCVNPGT